MCFNTTIWDLVFSDLKGVGCRKVFQLPICYKGVIPFIILQILVLGRRIVLFPEFYGFKG